MALVPLNEKRKALITFVLIYVCLNNGKCYGSKPLNSKREIYLGLFIRISRSILFHYVIHKNHDGILQMRHKLETLYYTTI